MVDHSWRYFVAYQSLEEALKSDGTPYVEVRDADIAAGELVTADAKPRYPIVISLAAEAVANGEITPLRDYVSAGGFLWSGPPPSPETRMARPAEISRSGRRWAFTWRTAPCRTGP